MKSFVASVMILAALAFSLWVAAHSMVDANGNDIGGWYESGSTYDIEAEYYEIKQDW